jgi:hypothetical protein
VYSVTRLPGSARVSRYRRSKDGTHARRSAKSVIQLVWIVVLVSMLLMRKRFRIGVVVFIGALFCFLWLALRPRGPNYQGKPLIIWLDQYGTNHWGVGRGGALDKQAETAIRNIGTNSIPSILGFISARESPFTLLLIDHAPLKLRHLLDIPDRRQYRDQLDHRRMLAAVGIEALGADAKAAIPELIALLNDTNDFVRMTAAFALGRLGPAAKDAVPTLVACLDDPAGPVRLHAAASLGEIHQDYDQVVPVLIKCAESIDTGARCPAVSSLGRFGSLAKPAIPVLLGLLDDRDGMMRLMATNALRDIDPEAARNAGIAPFRH